MNDLLEDDVEVKPLSAQEIRNDEYQQQRCIVDLTSGLLLDRLLDLIELFLLQGRMLSKKIRMVKQLDTRYFVPRILFYKRLS